MDQISTRKKKKLSTRMRTAVPIYIMLIPATVVLILFHYFPLYGLAIAFEDFSPFKGITGSLWVGLKHFKYFLSDENFWRVMKNTLAINFYQLIFGFPIPIIFALLLNEVSSTKLKKTVQTVSYLPHFISWVVVASIFTEILSPTTGLVNAVVKFFGGEPIYFLIKKEYFRTILVVQSTWKSFGMSAVYYIASLSGIDTELYEAAAIDGASKMKQIWHITLPGLRNIIVVLLVMQIGNMMTIGFDQIYLMYNPMVYDVGDVISTYTYRLGIEKTQYSLTSAVGISQSLVNFILVYGANRLSKKIAGWSLW